MLDSIAGDLVHNCILLLYTWFYVLREFYAFLRPQVSHFQQIAAAKGEARGEASAPVADCREREGSYKWQYTQQCEALTLEIKNLRRAEKLSDSSCCDLKLTMLCGLIVKLKDLITYFTNY
ncbi:hypothetical protein E2986_12242 [Frieseomelitta varia]|uniref:Uncharacterized protein n=1 Tax=Frieseomelitta varia TaxID=561572 RepID=A0A833SC95_9HYME|nr:hypothetical protein E2986_12242 [Frieseomelitta varia]